MKTFINLLVGLGVFFGAVMAILYLFKSVDKNCGYVEIYGDSDDYMY